MQQGFKKDLQYYKFCFYGFFKNLRFFDAFLMIFFLAKGLNFLEIGILYSVREIIIMLLEIPIGVISDALGRRKTLIVSFFAYIVSFIVFYYSENYFMLLMAISLFAVADATRTGVHKAMIFHYLKLNSWSSHKIDYYGHTRSWSQTGSAISALLAAVFVFYSENYNIIFIASIIPYLADMMLVYSYPKYLDGEITGFSKKKILLKFKIVTSAFLQTISSFNFIRVLSNLTIYTGYYRAIKDYIQPLLKVVALSMPYFAYLNDEKKIAITIGIIYTFLFLLTAVSSRLSGRFTRLFSHLNKPMNVTLVIGLVIGIIAGLAFQVGYYIIPIIGFVLIMIIENLRKPIGIGIVADISKDESMTTTLSLASQAKSVFAATIAPLTGFIADSYGPGAGIAFISMLLLAVIPVYWLKQQHN